MSGRRNAIVAGMVAALTSATAAVALVPTPIGPGPPVYPIASCAASELSATYSLDPFSQGAGNISYTLTITNRSHVLCVLEPPASLRLLGRHGKPLPTHASTSPSGSYTVPLAGGQWAQADSRFSPDISGPGEGSLCEATAHSLRIAIGGGDVIAPMDPTPVCQHGQIGFARLRAVPTRPACTSAHLSAKLRLVSNNGLGGADYGLALTNTGAAPCYLDGPPRLRLLDAAGRALPTRAVTSVPYPIVVGPHRDVSLLATFASIARLGSGEPRHGPCEPTAASVRIDPRPGGGRLVSALRPATRVCDHGLMTLSGLLAGYPFG